MQHRPYRKPYPSGATMLLWGSQTVALGAFATECTAQPINAVVNGSFEAGKNPGGWIRIPAEADVIPNWRVTTGAVDLIGTFYAPHSQGARSVDRAQELPHPLPALPS